MVAYLEQKPTERYATCSTGTCLTKRPKRCGESWTCPDCRDLFSRAGRIRKLLRDHHDVDPFVALSYVIAPPDEAA